MIAVLNKLRFEILNINKYMHTSNNFITFKN